MKSYKTILAALLFTAIFSFSNHFSNESSNSDLVEYSFVTSENIAFAEGGKSCVCEQASWWFTCWHDGVSLPGYKLVCS